MKKLLNEKLCSMVKLDFRRAFTTSLLYIMIGISFIAPVLILVMTSMMDGTVTVNPQTGVETVIQGFKSVWQIIGTVSGANSSMMDITGMCNINMMYFAVAVFVCIFVADDFRSGYAKNLFTVRANKTDYVLSKTLVGFFCGAIMIIAFFVGAMLGGAIAGLPFELDGFNLANLVACLISKMFLVLIFVSIYVLAGVIAKQRLWLSIILSLGIGMFMFAVIPMVTPLDSGFINVILTLAGGILFGAGLCFISKIILDKTSLV